MDRTLLYKITNSPNDVNYLLIDSDIKVFNHEQ